MDLYCVKCRIRTPTIDLTETVTKNNRNAITGRCETCDTKKFRFGKATTKKGPEKSGGDIATRLSKLPGAPWSKYPGEKHYPGYNYCGPGTRLDIRLDNQDNPKPGENPINAIDEACRIHDIAYRSTDLKQRHLADIRLIHAINAIPNKSLKEKIASFLIKTAMKGKLMIGADLKSNFTVKPKVKPKVKLMI